MKKLHSSKIIITLLLSIIFLSSCMKYDKSNKPEVSPLKQEGTDVLSATGKNVSMEKYTITIPAEWNYEKQPGDMLIFKMDNKAIGGINIQSFYPDQNIYNL